MSAVLELEVAPLSDELLERLDLSGARFEIAIYEAGRELARGPLWLPYWPWALGQRVRASEPTTFDATGEWRPDEFAAFGAGEELLRQSAALPPLAEMDSLDLTLTVRLSSGGRDVDAGFRRVWQAFRKGLQRWDGR